MLHRRDVEERSLLLEIADDRPDARQRCCRAYGCANDVYAPTGNQTPMTAIAAAVAESAPVSPGRTRQSDVAVSWMVRMRGR